MKSGVSFLLVFLALAACAPERQAPVASAPRATPLAVASEAPATLPAASGGQEVVALQRQVIALRQQVAELREQADYYQGETGRFQRGLEKCVAELNKVTGEAAAAPSYGSARPQRAAQARVHTLSAPRVQVAGDSAIVTVKVWNAGDGTAQGTVDLELVLDGEVIDSSSEWVEISPRTDQVVSATFFIGGARQGTYSARASLSF